MAQESVRPHLPPTQPVWFLMNNLREEMEAAINWNRFCCLHAMTIPLSNPQLVISFQPAATNFDQTDRDIWNKNKK